MKTFNLNDMTLKSGSVRVSEIRERFENGTWTALPTVVLFEGRKDDTQAALDTWVARYQKRLEQGFRMDKCVPINDADFTLQGTTPFGHRSTFIFESVAAPTPAEPLGEPVTGDPFAGDCHPQGSCCNGQHDHAPRGSVRDAVHAGNVNALKLAGKKARFTGFVPQAEAEITAPRLNAERGQRLEHQRMAPTVAETMPGATVAEFLDEAEKVYNPTPQKAAPTRLIQGTYTVVFPNGDYRTLKVEQPDPKRSFAPEKWIVSYLNGPDNWVNYKSFAFITNDTHEVRIWQRFQQDSVLAEAVRVLVADPESAGLAYAMASKCCYRCKRKLTVPASLHRGLGPECAAKVEGGF